jgi:putative peptide zinc metalloprotease protein
VARLLAHPRRAALIFVLAVLAFFLALVASRTKAIAVIDTGGGDNVAVAVNTKDGTTVAETAFLITLAGAKAVDQTNAAVAYSNCETCRTLAAAIQVVLVPPGETYSVTPTNAAIAVNEGCLSCETMALAYQKVLGVSGPVEFTKEGNKQIKEIQKGLKELGKDAEDLTLEEIQARFDELTKRLDKVLATELVPAGSSKKDPERDEASEPTVEEGAESTPESAAPESMAPATGETVTSETTTVEEAATGETTVQETVTEEKTLEKTPGETPPEEKTPAAPEGETPPKESVSGSTPADPAQGDPAAPPQPTETKTP